jgi:hypothetical protein
MKRNRTIHAYPNQPIDNLRTRAENLEEQIRLRAYQLYEQRGRQDGFADQDWAQAEAEIMNATNALKATA